MRRPPSAGLKASAGATTPSTQRVPGGLDMDNINLTTTFVADIPFASLDLKPAQLHADGTGLTARGLSSDSYAIIWVQSRQPDQARTDASITISGLQDGSSAVRPFDTWEGTTLAEITAQATSGQLTITLPAFRNDIALKLVRT